jgi:YD repeat-containing protein
LRPCWRCWREQPSRKQQTFRNERGQITGSSSTSGNVTTFRDRSGRMTGTAERMRDGSVRYRDAMGRHTGSAMGVRGELTGDEVDALLARP